jgi:hypothetical protein
MAQSIEDGLYKYVSGNASVTSSGSNSRITTVVTKVTYACDTCEVDDVNYHLPHSATKHTVVTVFPDTVG